jgi:hypothetical protein
MNLRRKIMEKKKSGEEFYQKQMQKIQRQKKIAIILLFLQGLGITGNLLVNGEMLDVGAGFFGYFGYFLISIVALPTLILNIKKENALKAKYEEQKKPFKE